MSNKIGYDSVYDELYMLNCEFIIRLHEIGDKVSLANEFKRFLTDYQGIAKKYERSMKYIQNEVFKKTLDILASSEPYELLCSLLQTAFLTNQTVDFNNVTDHYIVHGDVIGAIMIFVESGLTVYGEWSIDTLQLVRQELVVNGMMDERDDKFQICIDSFQKYTKLRVITIAILSKALVKGQFDLLKKRQNNVKEWLSSMNEMFFMRQEMTIANNIFKIKNISNTDTEIHVILVSSHNPTGLKKMLFGMQRSMKEPSEIREYQVEIMNG
eukprot:412916_1